MRTYEEVVYSGLDALKTRGGVSRPQLLKFLAQEEPARCDPALVNNTLKKMITKDLLVKHGARYAISPSKKKNSTAGSTKKVKAVDTPRSSQAKASPKKVGAKPKVRAIRLCVASGYGT